MFQGKFLGEKGERKDICKLRDKMEL
jgi:hypothetical protein